MTMALILAVSRRLAEGERLMRSRRVERLEPDLDAGPPHLGQAARHHRHGPDRLGGGPPRARLRPLGPLPQPAPRATRELEQRARGDLLGEPRPDAGADGHRLASTARTRRRPITCSRRGGSSCCSRTPIIVNTARGEVIDENALTRMLREQARSPAPASTCSSTSPPINPKLLRARQRRAAAAHGLGHDRGPHRHGREGHHQHQDLRRRPQAARPRDRAML